MFPYPSYHNIHHYPLESVQNYNLSSSLEVNTYFHYVHYKLLGFLGGTYTTNSDKEHLAYNVSYATNTQELLYNLYQHRIQQ